MHVGYDLQPGRISSFNDITIDVCDELFRLGVSTTSLRDIVRERFGKT